MKKRFLALLAAGAMLLTGCGAQGAANSNAEAGGDGGAKDNLHHLTVVLDWYRMLCTHSCMKHRRRDTLLSRVWMSTFSLRPVLTMR